MLSIPLLRMTVTSSRRWVRRAIANCLPVPLKSTLRQNIDNLRQAWDSTLLAQNLDHWRTDIYLVSYPRSGRTWLRTMIGTALCQQFGLAIDAPEKIADLWKEQAEIPVIRLSHHDIRLPHPQKFKHKKVILLIRNPLDIGVSHYHYRGQIEDMTERVRISVQEVIESYNKWAVFMADHPSCLIVKYEDLLASPQESLERIFQFMTLPQVCEGTVLQKTVDTCSFANLKQLAQDPTRSLFYRPQDSEMVRSGKAGSSKTELEPSIYTDLQTLVNQHLNPGFNYQVTPE